MTDYDIAQVRSRFPALRHDSLIAGGVDLDGPAGTQVPDSVIEAMAAVHRRGISNHGGGFPTSDASEEVTAGARNSLADLFNADPAEIVFGPNMTSLTFSVSRALSREWTEGDEIVVTKLDHDANVTPWRMAAADRGAVVREVPFNKETGLLEVEAFEEHLGPRTRMVAVTHASNALGTIPDVARIVELAKAAGAMTYVDAVHYTPHGVVDVAALGCDFLVASAYKFYGPHLGALYMRSELLERLTAYKVVPAPQSGPGKWETGTQSFESLAGATAAVDHMASLGDGTTRRDKLVDAQHRVRAHEMNLIDRFLAGVAEIPGVQIHGITDSEHLDRRVPTFSITIDGTDPASAVDVMRSQGLWVRSGDFYAVGVADHLGVADSGGLIRIGFVQYTDTGDVDRTLDGLAAAAD